MLTYNNQGRYKDVLELGNEMKKIIPETSLEDKNTSAISNIYRINGLALGYLGFDKAGQKDIKTAISYVEKVESKNTKMYLLSLCYQNMNIYYVNNQIQNKAFRDSTLYCLNKSTAAAEQIEDNNAEVSNDLKYEQIGFNYMRLGIFYLEQADKKGSIEQAEKYLLKGLKIYENKTYKISDNNRIMMLNQVSWLYTEKKDYRKSIDYAQRALALEQKFPDPYDRVESFEFLATSYLGLGENKKSKVYMDKYTYLKDSLRSVERNSVENSCKANSFRSY
ncbi:MAG: tetratricopeptide repeat protein [Flavobacterium sp.]